ncbi:MAG: ATP-binding protein [Clostridium sp.]|nr:ATP-binding protein [Clostridium sp.]
MWLLLYPCAFMISSTGNVAVSFLMAIILNIPQATVADNPVLELMANSFFTVLMIIIYLRRRIYHSHKQHTLTFSNPVYIVTTAGNIIFYLLIGLVQYIGSLHHIPSTEANILGFFLSCASMIFCLFFLWLSGTIYKNETLHVEKNILNVYLTEQEKYIQLILEKDKEMRSFRHDVKEHLYILSRCLEQRNYEEAKRYITKINECFSVAQLKRYTGIITIDAIISEKKNCMDTEGISFTCEINANKLPEHIIMYDVCTILINVLNNAIEACEDLEAENRNIRLIMDTTAEKLYIYEKNPLGHEIVFDENQNPISSQKDDSRHGFGSKNIRNVAEKYGGIINYTVSNQFFTIEVII